MASYKDLEQKYERLSVALKMKEQEQKLDNRLRILLELCHSSYQESEFEKLLDDINHRLDVFQQEHHL